MPIAFGQTRRVQKLERHRKLDSGGILEYVETSRRGTGSAIGDPEQTSPPGHSFRPACALELPCGVAVVITEQAAQSLATSHLPVETADAFFRLDQRVPSP